MRNLARFFAIAIVLPVAFVVSACQPVPLPPPPAAPSTPVPQVEVNKAIVRRVFREVWNQGKLDTVDELVAAGRVQHEPTGDVVGPDSFKQWVTGYRAAFPDIQFTVHDQIAEGDEVVTRWSAIGTFQGEVMGIPPTGKKKEPTTGIVIDRIVDGKIVETWSSWDTLGFMQQMEVIPPMGREHFGWSEPSKVTGAPGAPDANKAIAQRYTEEVWNQQRLAVLDEIMHPAVVSHEATTEHVIGQGLDAMKQGTTIYLTAFPDLHVTVDATIAEGDKVVQRWTATGTNNGDLLGIPATGKKATWTGITIYRFADGKIVEMWWSWDALGLLQQLGVIPLPPAALKGAHAAFQKALNAHDLEQWLGRMTNDAVWDYVPNPTPMDKEGIRAFFEDLFQAFPDWHVDSGRVLIAGNILVQEHRALGTHQGEWMGIPASGDSTPTPHIDIAEFDGDKVKRITTYLDMSSVLMHLGAMPVPELPELKPSFDLPAPEPTGLSPVEADIEALARWNRHDLVAWAKMFRTDADIFLAPLGPLDREGVVAATELYFEGVPDDYGKVTRRIDLGDGWVLAEVVWTGTNSGPYFGVPPTGNPVNVRGAWLAHFDEDGLMTYLHVYYDGLTILQQLGLAPAAGGSGQ